MTPAYKVYNFFKGGGGGFVPGLIMFFCLSFCLSVDMLYKSGT